MPSLCPLHCPERSVSPGAVVGSPEQGQHPGHAAPGGRAPAPPSFGQNRGPGLVLLRQHCRGPSSSLRFLPEPLLPEAWWQQRGSFWMALPPLSGANCPEQLQEWLAPALKCHAGSPSKGQKSGGIRSGQLLVWTGVCYLGRRLCSICWALSRGGKLPAAHQALSSQCYGHRQQTSTPRRSQGCHLRLRLGGGLLRLTQAVLQSHAEGQCLK